MQKNFIIETYKVYKKFFFNRSFFSILIISLLFISSLAEVIGVSALLLFLMNFFSPDLIQSSLLNSVFDNIFIFLGFDPTLNIILSFFSFFIFLKAFLLFFALYLSSSYAASIAYDIRIKLLQGLLNVKYDFILNQPLGSIITSLDFDSEKLAITYEKICRSLNLLIQALTYTLLAMLVSPELSSLILIFAVLCYFFFSRLNNLMYILSHNILVFRRLYVKNLSKFFHSIKVFKVMGNENFVFNKLNKNFFTIYKNLKKYWFVESIILSIQEPVIFIFLILTMFVGLEFFSVPIGNMLIIYVAFFRISTRMVGYYNSTRSIVTFLPSVKVIEKLSYLLNKNKEDNKGLKSFNLNNIIFFKNIDFKYKKNVIFNNANFNILPNKVNFIYGKSGIGKTTLLDLLISLREPDSGQIIIGKTLLENINKNLYKKSFGYVTQDPYLFDDTILNNICLNKRLQTDYLFKLVRLFCCNTFIKSNKDLNKPIGTSGAKLSGGQKQKLAILRAVINKPRILILDEATSELSANEESKIFKNLKKLKSNITIILISHNMNLKKYADRSLLISNNKVKKVS